MSLLSLIFLCNIIGVLISLETLAGCMKFPVYGLQCTASAPLTSISDLAAFYLQVCIILVF